MTARAATVTIVGAGALARAVVEALPRRRTLRVVVAARRPAAARALARRRPGTIAVSTCDQAVRDAAVVLLAVDDGAITPLARTLADCRASWRGAVVLHAAGALGPAALAPLTRRGAAAGVLHPFLPLGRGGGIALRGAYARIEGTPRAIAAARRLAALLGLTPLRRTRVARPRDREIHHAAAALATNDVVALFAFAEDALVASGVSRREARRAIGAASSAALALAATKGPAAALSGPVARGDAARVLSHLGTLASVHREAAAAHRALSLRLIELAEAAGRLDGARARSLRSAVAGSLRGSKGGRGV